MPRFLMRGEGVTEWPSMQSERSWQVGRADFGPKTMISVLLLFSLRKLWFIQVLMSVRQQVRIERMLGEMDLVVRYSWVSSA